MEPYGKPPTIRITHVNGTTFVHPAEYCHPNTAHCTQTTTNMQGKQGYTIANSSDPVPLSLNQYIHEAPAWLSTRAGGTKACAVVLGFGTSGVETPNP